MLNDKDAMIAEAHGGGSKLITLKIDSDFPVFSVFRRKL